jgi:cytidine deaminase
MIEITDAEDKKILTLARSTRARTGAAQGACVRDTDGRTYAAASIDLPSLQLSAVQVAVAMAVSSGAQGLEAVAVLADPVGVADADLAAVRDLAGSGVQVLVGSPDGRVQDQLRS